MTMTTTDSNETFTLRWRQPTVGGPAPADRSPILAQSAGEPKSAAYCGESFSIRDGYLREFDVVPAMRRAVFT